MFSLVIDVLRRHFAADPTTYISGNMFLYYVPGNKWRHFWPPTCSSPGGVPPETDQERKWHA